MQPRKIIIPHVQLLEVKENQPSAGHKDHLTLATLSFREEAVQEDDTKEGSGEGADKAISVDDGSNPNGNDTLGPLPV